MLSCSVSADGLSGYRTEPAGAVHTSLIYWSVEVRNYVPVNVLKSVAVIARIYLIVRDIHGTTVRISLVRLYLHPYNVCAVSPFHHRISGITDIGDITVGTVQLLGEVILIEVIIDCTVELEHTRPWHEECISPRAVVECTACIVHLCRYHSNCIQQVSYTCCRVAVVSVDVKAVHDVPVATYLISESFDALNYGLSCGIGQYINSVCHFMPPSLR